MMKFISVLDKYSPYLTDKDIYTIGKSCKKFYKPCHEKLKENLKILKISLILLKKVLMI